MKNTFLICMLLFLFSYAIPTQDFPFYFKIEHQNNMMVIINYVKTAINTYDDINKDQGLIPVYLKIENDISFSPAEDIDNLPISDTLYASIISTLTMIFKNTEIKELFLTHDYANFLKKYYQKLQQHIEKKCNYEISLNNTKTTDPIYDAYSLLKTNDKPLHKKTSSTFEVSLYLLMYGKQITSDPETRTFITHWLAEQD